MGIDVCEEVGIILFDALGAHADSPCVLRRSLRSLVDLGKRDPEWREALLKDDGALRIARAQRHVRMVDPGLFHEVEAVFPSPYCCDSQDEDA